MAVYEIAFNLGKFAYEVNELPYEEIQGWSEYFARRPYGWREDDRTFKLLQAQGYKGKPGSLFPSLDAIRRKRPSTDGKIRMEDLQGSSLFQKLVTAQGGVNIFCDTSQGS